MESDHGLFVAEGARTVRQLVATDWPLRSLFLVASKLDSMADVVTAAESLGCAVYLGEPAVFDAVAGFKVHRGVLALAERPVPVDADRLLESARAAVITEGINDHENLGAIFRNGAALGADALLLDPTTCDPLYRRAVRVSVGHVLTVPNARLSPWPDALRRVADHGLSLVALSPHGDTDLADVPILDRFALMVGAEGHGLTDPAMAFADHVARIPMTAGTDSVNVATAMAIALYQLSRRRIG